MTQDAATSFTDGVSALRNWVETARFGIVFTGAGLSTESGVPDFRTPGSPWLTHKPIPFAAFLASEEARLEGWRRKFAMDEHYSGAKPSRGHRVIADLIARQRLQGVVTQNIDDLHQASGIAPDQIVELHGNGTYAACLDCQGRHELAWCRSAIERSGVSPRCDACGGLVKSATISFGQQMPQGPLRRAQDWTLACDLFIVIGSSLVVYPAAALPALAKRNGATLVIINRQPTELDAMADLTLHQDIGDVLAALRPQGAEIDF